MKKILTLLVMTGVMGLLIVPNSMAGGYKVPKEFCFFNDGVPGNAYVLAFKKLTKVKAPDGKKTYYAINGEINANIVVTGTAYLEQDTPNRMKAAFTGVFENFHHWTIFTWDLDAESGYIYHRYSDGITTGTINGNVMFNECDEIPIVVDAPPFTETGMK